ncbi:oligosaccharide flippase family protein [Metabacillus idriensis]|uniref:oligosaccharide flippase family protein n=1 Tax=Metabacillus idriensis TaxID=324768 RepID=UPI00281448E9|nr:oligosaccharide flippase family protein [Metabacillus idriensis]MDR0138852.1 oligosaccharide flippase family protein [Metabacillus idriensis]
MSKFIKGSILLTSAKVIDLVVDLLNIAIISRVFTLSEYGLFSQIIIISTIISTLINLGLPNSINYFLARQKQFSFKKKYISNILIISNVFGIFSFLILLFIGDNIVIFFNARDLGEYIYVLAILPWMKAGILLRDNAFIVMDKTTNAIINRVVMSLTRLVLPISVLFWGISFESYLSIFLLIEILLYVYVLVSILFLFHGLSLQKINFRTIKEILIFSLPLGLALMVGSINVQLDKLIISKYFNTEELAIYVNASRELPVVALSASIVTIIMPSLVDKLRDNRFNEVVELWRKVTNFSFFLISPIIAIVFVMSSEVMTILYSEKYLSGLNVFRIYVIILYFRIIYFGMILNASGNTKKILISSIASLVINVFFSIIFINMIGFTGPAWATLLSVIIIAYYQLRETSKVVNHRIIDLFPLKNMGFILLKDVILIIFIYFIKNLILEPLQIPAITTLIIVVIIWIFFTWIVFRKSFRGHISF